MKTASTYFVRMLILSLLVLQSVPIKALPSGPAGMAYALPEAKAGATYEFTIRTEGGQPPFKWSVIEGDLPPGIELQPSGILRGTPTVPRARAYDFTLKVSDSSEPPQTHIQRFAIIVTTAAWRTEVQRQQFTGKDAWKNKYVKQQEDKATEVSTKPETSVPASPASRAGEAQSGNNRQKPTANPPRAAVSEFEVRPPSTDQARAQHKSDQELVREFVTTSVTVLDPKNVSDNFGRRIAKRYVAFKVTVSNDNRDYQFLIQDLIMDLSEVAPDLESYRPSPNSIGTLRGVSEKGQVYDWRNLSMRLLEGTGTIAASLGTGVIAVGRAYAPSVAAYNGPLANAFRHVFPDLTVTQSNRVNDQTYRANALVPRHGSEDMIAFVDMAMLLMDGELQKRFYKSPLSIADFVDFRKAKAVVRGMLITDVLDQPPLISAVVISDEQKAHFTDKPATIEGTIVGRNLTGASIQIDNKGVKVEAKGTPESNRLNFIVKSDEPILPGSVLTFVVVRKNDVAKQDFPVSYMIAAPTLTDVKPTAIKQGDPETDFTLTGTGFVKGLFSVIGCERIKIKDPVWQSDKEIKIKLEVPADAAEGPCELRVKNGESFVSGQKTFTIEKAKEKEKEKGQKD